MIVVETKSSVVYFMNQRDSCQQDYRFQTSLLLDRLYICFIFPIGDFIIISLIAAEVCINLLPSLKQNAYLSFAFPGAKVAR